MRKTKKFIAAVVTTIFGLSTITTAGPLGLGEIIRSEDASINGVSVPQQGTVRPGAVLTTGERGSALVQFSPDTQANLLDSTSVTFRSESGHLSAEMSSGTVGARSFGEQPLIVETPGYSIEPLPQHKALYVVTMLLDRTTVVSARQGFVVIVQRSSGEKYVLSQGHYAKIAEDAPRAVPPQNAQNGPSGPPPGLLGSPGKLFVISVGAGVGIALILDKTILAPPAASPSAP